MSDDEGFTRKSTRMAAIEAAKRIKKNADANKSLSYDDEEEIRLYEATMCKPLLVAPTDNGGDNNNTQRRRGRKRKMSNQVFDPTNPPSKAQGMGDLSTEINKFIEVNPSKCENMSKRRRGRPPKSRYAKCTLTPNTSIRFKKSEFKHEEEVDYAANRRRESYNNSLAKNEPILTTVFCSPKQLQPVNGRMSYKESLMTFSKDLGPTARKVALQMLQNQGANYQARHWLPSSNTDPHPRFVDMGSIKGSVGNTKPNQVGQPLTSLGGSNNTYANYIADYKGKKIMVDDGKTNGNKWNFDNLEGLLGKMKGGVKIGNAENVSSENQEFGHGQVGINPMIVDENGSFLPKNNGNLQQNVHMIVDEKKDAWINASKETRRNGKHNSYVDHPSTYLQPSKKVSSSLMGLDGGVNLLIPQVVPPPLEHHRPPPVQPSENWCPPPPPEIKNTIGNDGFYLQEELQLALANYMQMENNLLNPPSGI